MHTEGVLLVIFVKNLIKTIVAPNQTNTPDGSWLDTFDFKGDQHSSWLDLYRRNLSWIKSSGKDDDETINDLASEV